MKLFDNFEAVKFPEEDMIFITRDGYLYYVYSSKYNHWEKYRNAGNDRLTVSKYPDVSKDELINAMRGIFPRKESDFMRLCDPSQLNTGEMLCLLNEDYEKYMSDSAIRHMIHLFLSRSDIRYRLFEKIQKLLNTADANNYSDSLVIAQIKALSFKTIGKDIFKKEIGIVDGHESSSYFWIMPVRVIDYSDTNESDNIAEMRCAEISIEEDNVALYLAPFLYNYCDNDLEANKRRVKDRWLDDDGNEQTDAVLGFEWNLTHNYFSFDSIEQILNDIADTADALISGRETEYTKKLKIKRGNSADRLYSKNPSEEGADEIMSVIDFYNRFLYRMKYMMTIGKENGYDLISFMGP